MKNIPSTLAAYLPATLSPIMIGCYSFSLINGSTLRFCDHQAALVVQGTGSNANTTYPGTASETGGFGMTGLKLAQKIGLDADEQQATLLWRAISDPYGPSTVGGVALPVAFRNGLFDKAEFTWGVATLSAWPLGGTAVQPVGWGGTCPDGTVFSGIGTVFKGRVGEVKGLGPVSAQLTLKSDLIALEGDIPHRVFQPSCVHIFGDDGCTINLATYTTSGSVGQGASNTIIPWSGSVLNSYTNGTITFTSGINSGVAATIKYSSATYLQLSYPLNNPPRLGDTFTAVQGCPHTQSACTSRFGNLANFLGFPFIPPPESAV